MKVKLYFNLEGFHWFNDGMKSLASVVKNDDYYIGVEVPLDFVSRHYGEEDVVQVEKKEIKVKFENVVLGGPRT